jgi:hypothetical protein
MGAPSDLEKPPVVKSAERKFLWKVEFTVLALLWLLYLVCLVERINIGNAKIQGMEVEVSLKGQKYIVAVFIFNAGHVVAGVPLSIAFKKDVLDEGAVEDLGEKHPDFRNKHRWWSLLHVETSDTWMYSSIATSQKTFCFNIHQGRSSRLDSEK